MSHALRPRTGATDAEVNAVAEIAAALLARRAAPPPDKTTWRFSGRWFAAHPYSELRRPA